MKRKDYTTVVFIALLTILATACTNDDDTTREYRHFRYEVSGTVTGPVEVQYTPTISDPYEDLDDLEYDETITLPWTKEVSLHHLASGVGLSVSVDDGVAGEIVSIEIYRDDELVASHTGAVDADGSLSFLVNYYNDGTIMVHGD
ncbi:hypothetical protein [Sinomicrobium sp. M5D2P9]